MSFPLLEQASQNPYYHLTMVRDPRMFFGRHEALSHLYATIRDQQCLSLVGPRRIGKSSLLGALHSEALQRRLGYDLSTHVLAYIDSGEQPQKTYEDFLTFISEQLIVQNQDRLAALQTQSRRDANGFRHFLEEIKARGLHPVLLLDEFENIAGKEQFEPSFFFFLRAQANVGKVSYITASKKTLDKICHADLIGSPFFNIFSTYKLGPLISNEALELITIPSQQAGRPFSSIEIEWVQNIAGRHPFFIQRTCYFLFEAKGYYEQAAIDLDGIEQQVHAQLSPHFGYAWSCLEMEQQEQLAWEARRQGVIERKIPELSESQLFRIFVRKECNMDLSSITVDYLDKILDKIDDAQFLGESMLGYLNIVYIQAKGIAPSAIERGIIVQQLLLSTIEELKLSTEQKKDDVQWRIYHILSLRCKEKLRNEEIAARLAISIRHFFRERIRALRTLLNILLRKELLSKEDY